MAAREKFRPLQDRVLVRRMTEEQTTASGIVIPDSAKEKPSRGEIMAVGRGKSLDSGEFRSMDLKVGDIIMFGKYSGTEVKINNEDFIIMREDDIFGIIEG